MKTHFFAGAALTLFLGCGQEEEGEPCDTSSTGICDTETSGGGTDGPKKKFGVCELDEHMKCKPKPLLTHGVCELGALGCDPDPNMSCMSNFWYNPETKKCSGPIGTRNQACTLGEACDPGLVCEDDMCICPSGEVHCWCKDDKTCNPGLTCMGNICWR